MHQESFAHQVKQLMADGGWSVRALAAAAEVDPTHLSRVLRGKPVTESLARRTAQVLKVDPARFPEIREAEVIQAVKTDPQLRDRIFGRL